MEGFVRLRIRVSAVFAIALWFSSVALPSAYAGFVSVTLRGRPLLQQRIRRFASPTPTRTPAPTPRPTRTPSPTPSPIPSPTPKPTPTASATPAATPTPANFGAEITINSPLNGQTVSGSAVPVVVTLGPDVWWDQLQVDGVSVLSGSGNFTWDSTAVTNGTHTLTVRVFQQGGTAPIGSSYISIVVSNAAPTPTPNSDPTSTPAPTGTPTPVPSATPSPVAHYSLSGPGISLPSESACAASVSANSAPENAPWNANDGTGYNSNAGIASTPSYFYANAGSQLGYPNADFAQVDGQYAGTTDDIMRVYSCKWGEDEDWMRAQSWIETGWHQDCAAMHGGSGCNENGDYNHPDGICYGLVAGLSDSGFAVTNGGGQYVFGNFFGLGAYASWGIIQSKSACAEYYAQPMLALSTSWGEDYEGAKFRSCMNGNANSRFRSSAYLSDVSNAKNNPNGKYSGGEPAYLGSGETNLQHLALGCVITHYSGGWFDSSAASYATAFVNALNTHPWPGGLH